SVSAGGAANRQRQSERRRQLWLYKSTAKIGGSLRCASRCAGFRATLLNALVFHPLRPLWPRRCGSVPLELVHIGEERRIDSERRQILEQQRALAIGAEHFWRKRLDGPVAIEECGCGGRTDATNSRIAILRIADERQQVRNQIRVDSELRAHAFGVSNLHTLADDLHHSIAAHALGEILVVGPDANFVDARIF